MQACFFGFKKSRNKVNYNKNINKG
ncbi:DUF2648 domain-containing protein [Bacillus safensis]|nr:DUF2648 domain-containing protein [Bacillus pumilus]NWF41153.1 DUF2648 domain-containing protein [Bacillus sp. 8A6]RAU60038.1 DUF2648 domain-containing protein [Bacillus safensis]